MPHYDKIDLLHSNTAILLSQWKLYTKRCWQHLPNPHLMWKHNQERMVLQKINLHIKFAFKNPAGISPLNASSFKTSIVEFSLQIT